MVFVHRGRQKKRPTVEKPADDSDDDLDLSTQTQGKKPRAFQSGGENQLQLPGTQKASFPKILKRDLRRVFGQMYLNVLNSGDPILFARFMRQYVNYNAQYQRYVGNANRGSVGTIRMESSSSGSSVEKSRDIPLIVGRDAIMYFLASHHETAPDTITICQQGSIRQHLNSSESEIVLQVKMAGTRLYMIEWQELMQLIASSQQQQHGSAASAATSDVSSLHASSRASGASAATAAADDDDAAAAVGNNSLFLEQFRRATQQKLLQTGATSLSSQELSELALLHFTDRMKRVMLTSPAKFEMEGTFTLYLDECFNVYRFDFARHSLQLEAMPELNPYRHHAAASGVNSSGSGSNGSSVGAHGGSSSSSGGGHPSASASHAQAAPAPPSSSSSGSSGHHHSSSSSGSSTGSGLGGSQPSHATAGGSKPEISPSAHWILSSATPAPPLSTAGSTPSATQPLPTPDRRFHVVQSFEL